MKHSIEIVAKTQLQHLTDNSQGALLNYPDGTPAGSDSRKPNGVFLGSARRVTNTASDKAANFCRRGCTSDNVQHANVNLQVSMYNMQYATIVTSL